MSEQLGDQPNPADKPKVGEIAKSLHISASTVSKVINGRPGVSDTTRQRVEEALAERGYAHPLVSTKASRTIELVVDHIANNGTIEMIRYCSSLALQQGMALTVTQTDFGRKRDECFRGIIDRNPFGVVLHMSDVSERERALLASRGIPLVVIDPVSLVGENDMAISIDNWTGGFQATQHLIDLGHTRIGIVTGPMNVQSAVARYDGYRAAMERYELHAAPELVRHGDYLPDKGYEAVCGLFDLPDRPTAVCCCNDLTAVGAYRAARERHLAIGKDISIVGFDNVYPAQYLVPGLTTVNQPFDLISKRAVEMLVRSRAGDEATERHIVLPTRLVVRGSTTIPAMPTISANRAV